jgi:hypothetical protein
MKASHYLNSTWGADSSSLRKRKEEIAVLAAM